MAGSMMTQLWKIIPRGVRAPVSAFAERVLPYLYRSGKRVCVDGIEFRVGVENLGGLRRTREFPVKEGNFTLAVLEAAKRHETIYDIGAHVGYYVLLVARANTSAKVVALEPEPSNFAALQRNLQLNDVSNVVACAVGAGEHDSQQYFAVDNSSGRSGGGTHRLGASGAGSGVRVVKLDDWILQSGLSPPGMLLLDIEGGELSALRGMQRILQDSGPELFVEVHTRLLEQRGQSEQELDEYLASLGYEKEVLRAPRGVKGEHQQKHVRYVRRHALLVEAAQ